jgi:hypothetical protein
MTHTEQNFLGREDNFLHSTPKFVVIRKGKTSTCFPPPHHSRKEKIFQSNPDLEINRLSMNIPHGNLSCISLNAIQRSQKFIHTDQQSIHIPLKFVKMIRHGNVHTHESEALV